MKLNSLLVVLVGICIFNEVSATFNLGDEGVDVCNTCKKKLGGITAPRPHPIPIVRPPSLPLIKTVCRQEVIPAGQPLKPIGDICNCGKQIVKPAPLPINLKPWEGLPKINLCPKSCSCDACASKPETPDSGCGSPVRAPEEYQIYNQHGATIYLDSQKKKNVARSRPSYGKADVVSVAIARQLANKARNSISEKQLQYGSLKDPVIPERTEKKTVSTNINEESFYSTNGDVLEINSNLFRQPKQVSSESDSSEEVKPRRKQATTFDPASLRYDDIGYSAYRPSSNPRYVIVKNPQAANHDCPHSGFKQKQNLFKTIEKPCDCYKDLVVEQSEISEQSVSSENDSEQNLFPVKRLRT